MKGAVVWFTGLPASGKTTLARRVQATLVAEHPCVLLDGDDLRPILRAHHYAAAERDVFYRQLAELAVYLAKQGALVLVAATAPRRTHRDIARAAPRFVEVHVATPLEVCEKRDFKGLYARASAGQAADLPGVGAPYEAPLDPDVVARGGLDDDAVRDIRTHLG